MTSIQIVLAMLLAVIASGLLVRALPVSVPAPLVQVTLGALIAAFTDEAVELDPDIFFLLFVPPLLFLDGWRIPKEGLLRDKGMILALALGLVVLTVLGMGWLIHWLIPAMPLAVAFALAAILSPTDPVAVSAITNRVAMPRRLQHVLEGESLLNDASGLVCFRFAVAAVLTGTFSLPDATLTFLQLAIGGIAVGAGLTFGVMTGKNLLAMRLGEDSGSQVLISLLLPFGAYLAAEHLHCSGILAAVAAGITMSYMELTGRAEGSTRVQRSAVWDTLQFALNGGMFVLLGEQLPRIFEGAVNVVQQTHHDNPAWLVVYTLAINAGLVALRFGWVWGSVKLAALAAQAKGSRPAVLPRARAIAAMSFAGARGAITLAGVLTLPLLLPDGRVFPARDLAIFLAATTTVLSLLLASLFLPRLLRGLASGTEPAIDEEVDRARLAAAQAAIEAIRRQLHLDHHDGTATDIDLHTEAAARVMETYQRRIDRHHGGADSTTRLRHGQEIEINLRLAALRAERETVFALARTKQLSDEASRRLVRELDLLEERLSSR